MDEGVVGVSVLKERVRMSTSRMHALLKKLGIDIGPLTPQGYRKLSRAEVERVLLHVYQSRGKRVARRRAQPPQK